MINSGKIKNKNDQVHVFIALADPRGSASDAPPLIGSISFIFMYRRFKRTLKKQNCRRK